MDLSDKIDNALNALDKVKVKITAMTFNPGDSRTQGSFTIKANTDLGEFRYEAITPIETGENSIYINNREIKPDFFNDFDYPNFNIPHNRKYKETGQEIIIADWIKNLQNILKQDNLTLEDILEPI